MVTWCKNLIEPFYETIRANKLDGNDNFQNYIHKQIHGRKL